MNWFHSLKIFNQYVQDNQNLEFRDTIHAQLRQNNVPSDEKKVHYDANGECGNRQNKNKMLLSATRT